MQHGRGVALADFNRDGRTDIVYGNWNGPHRLFLQLNNRKQKFKVGADGLPPSSSFSKRSRLLCDLSVSRRRYIFSQRNKCPTETFL